jgi:hypothetical protein
MHGLGFRRVLGYVYFKFDTFESTRRNQKMKQLTLKSALLGFLLLFVGLAFAVAEQNSVTLVISEPASIAGTTLNPGHYKVKWQTSGENTTLTILDGKKVVATVPVQVKQEPGPSADNAALRLTGEGSARSITAVYTPKLTFVVEQNATASNGKP